MNANLGAQDPKELKKSLHQVSNTLILVGQDGTIKVISAIHTAIQVFSITGQVVYPADLFPDCCMFCAVSGPYEGLRALPTVSSLCCSYYSLKQIGAQNFTAFF